MTAAYTWVGYAAGTLTTIAFLPQVLHVWRTKRADDLHMGTLVSFMAGRHAVAGLWNWDATDAGHPGERGDPDSAMRYPRIEAALRGR